MKKFAIIIIALVLVLTGCIKDDEVITLSEQLEIDLAIIDSYLGDNNITAQVHESGLRYVIHKEGTGLSPTTNDVVEVDYVGSLLSDGTVFDTSIENLAKSEGIIVAGRTYEPFQFSLGTGSVIKGWDIGIGLLKEGSDATLYLPSGLGYGTRGNSSIPPNANLIFDVTLISVK